MYLKVSVTATERGLTEHQLRQIERRLVELKYKGAEFLIHGDCVGGDSEIDTIARVHRYKIITFPSTLTYKRAFCKPVFHEHPPEPPLKRNPKIVKFGDVLLVAPQQRYEVLRSGTWTTKRWAERLNKPFELFLP